MKVNLKIIPYSHQEEFYQEFMQELTKSTKDLGELSVTRPSTSARMRSFGIPFEQIMIALGSAGAFTALCRLLSKYLERYRDREVIVEKDGTKISLKGLPEPEVKNLLIKLLPDSMLQSESRESCSDKSDEDH